MTDSKDAAFELGQALGAEMVAKIARQKHIEGQQNLGRQQAQHENGNIGRVIRASSVVENRVEADMLCIHRDNGLYFALTRTGPDAMIKVSNGIGDRYFLTLDDLAHLARLNGVMPKSYRPEVVKTDVLERFIDTTLDPVKRAEFTKVVNDFYKFLASPASSIGE